MHSLNNTILNQAQEITSGLKDGGLRYGMPGKHWRDSFVQLGVDVPTLIREDKTRPTKKYIMARFEYCLRSNQPTLVSSLLTKKTKFQDF